MKHDLEPHLHRVPLTAGQSIFQAHETLQTAYFPESGVISLTARSTGGEMLEVGLVGRDGMAGVALVPGVNMMPYEAVVLADGTARRISADVLKRAVRDSDPLHQLLGRYAYYVFAMGVQCALCNNFHAIRQRCARWLLMLHDLTDGDTFPVTQNLLALMLGVRRPSVTLAANTLQGQRLMDYRHGHLTIRDRKGLEAAACECYRLMRDEQRRLLGY